jgi:hypothetical protein
MPLVDAAYEAAMLCAAGPVPTNSPPNFRASFSTLRSARFNDAFKAPARPPVLFVLLSLQVYVALCQPRAALDRAGFGDRVTANPINEHDRWMQNEWEQSVLVGFIGIIEWP